MRQVRNFLIFMCLIVLFAGISAYAEDTMIYGCYKKVNGQLRVVSNTDECSPSELPISWNDGVQFIVRELYVNSATGQDISGYGLDEETPFKTIQYAVDQIPFLRLTPEFAVTIFIAPGSYIETILIDINQVKLIKSGDGTVVIEGASDLANVITVEGARGVLLKDITIQGGYRGIHGRKGAEFEIVGGLIQNTGNRGIMLDGNTSASLTDCTVQNCGNDGVGVFLNSSLAIYGDGNFINNNRAGIWGWNHIKYPDI